MTNANLKAVKIITVTVITLLIILASVLVYQLIKISYLKAGEAELQTKLNYLNEQKIYYSSENAYLETDAFLDRYAREVLGFGKAGEFIFK